MHRELLEKCTLLCVDDETKRNTSEVYDSSNGASIETTLTTKNSRKMGRNKEKYERKRGKKKRGSASTSQGQAPPAHQSFHQQDFIPLQEIEAGQHNEDIGARPEHTAASASGNDASWMLDKRPMRDNETSAPFGLVEPDLKAYLRSAHVQLHELVANVLSEGRVLSNDGEIKALRNAMLDEIKGKELVLATDADTSLILEDMLCTLGERQTRILADALSKE